MLFKAEIHLCLIQNKMFPKAVLDRMPSILEIQIHLFWMNFSLLNVDTLFYICQMHHDYKINHFRQWNEIIYAHTLKCPSLSYFLFILFFQFIFSISVILFKDTSRWHKNEENIFIENLLILNFHICGFVSNPSFI